MIDTGATSSCSAQHCVETSSNIPKLLQGEYVGSGIVAVCYNVCVNRAFSN